MSIIPSDGLVFELEGVTIAAPAELITPSIAEALSSGAYEAEEAEIVQRMLKPCDRVLEIGAGLGFVTTLIARDPRAIDLIAVEADPRLARRVETTLAINDGEGAAEVVNAVLSAEAPAGATATFYQRADFWMSSLQETDVPHETTVELPVIALNPLLRERAINCIVCDIEGGEVSLFAEADLTGVDRVMIELHDHVTGLSGVSDLFQTFRSKGFVYDPRCSLGSVVLFRCSTRLRTNGRTDWSDYSAGSAAALLARLASSRFFARSISCRRRRA